MDRSDERGVVSLVGLCVLMVVFLFGLALAHFVHSGGALAAEYEREMQLRLPHGSKPLRPPTAYRPIEAHTGR